MEKRIKLVLCLAIILVIVGCGSIGRNKDEPREIDYRTGTRGLTLDFPVDTLTQVYENDPDVRMIVEIRNEGAFPQFDDTRRLNGHIWVGGFDSNIIDLRPDEDLLDDQELEGKSPYNDRGGYSAIVLSGAVHPLPEGTTYYNPNIIVTATYRYTTIAAPEICIDPAPRSTDVKEKVCNVYNYDSVSLSSSQGAPVAVTRVEEDATHDNILFKIYIKNVGDGLVIDQDDIDNDPNKGYDWDRLNMVKIEDITVGNRKMTECRPDLGDYVHLIKDEGYIFCRFSTAGISNVYTTPLNIKLEYGYSNSIERDIEIFEEIEY